MRLADPVRLQARANTDPEFRIAARYWNATLRLESSSGRPSNDRAQGDRSSAQTEALLVEVADGQVARCGQATPGETATITIAAADEGWKEFLAAVPRPYYQDLLGGCVQHHGFTVAGDVLSLSAYYQAVQRLFAIMRELRGDTGGGSHATR